MKNKTLVFILLFLIFSISSVDAEELPAILNDVHVINHVNKNESK